MYQESDDKLHATAISDALLVVLLIAAFFLIGGVATFIKTKFDNDLPIYIFALLCAVCVYIVYRVRILGYRYTVFHKEPEPEYDPRFDDYIKHEDYPYPVGTFVAERTTSAKGSIIDVVDKSQMKALLAPGEEYAGADTEVVCTSRKKAKAWSLVYEKDAKTVRMYISPSEELLGYIRGFMEASHSNEN